jgi:hypothetical protein
VGSVRRRRKHRPRLVALRNRHPRPLSVQRRGRDSNLRFDETAHTGFRDRVSATTPTQPRPRPPASRSTPPAARAACRPGGLYPCRDNSATTPRQLRGEPGHERPKRTARSDPRHISHPARLLSTINTSETMSAGRPRLCTPSQGPMTLSAGTSRPPHHKPQVPMIAFAHEDLVAVPGHRRTFGPVAPANNSMAGSGRSER